ncbi:MAG: cobalt-precorrin-5B (C(1))-methyltransferase CbiD [Eggerthellaceae bacterium]|nr:cobalt-precorrin-5B (C(1))-methyltransferase CbiD [Eggerthellaceae bacterium]
MAFEEYTYSGTERLRRGYTTGTCATLAAKAGCIALLTGQAPQIVSVMTPAGIEVTVEPILVSTSADEATFGVIKDAGDDYDVTNGAEVRCTVRFIESGIDIDGGSGVGRVTAKGLNQPPGNAAINSGSRKQIQAAVQECLDTFDCLKGISVVVEVVNGEEIAKKTFNPSIGIEGGISIIGTTGIVEPRSLKALKDALEVEIRYQAAQGHKNVIVTPGNYGESFSLSLELPPNMPLIKCANFIGETLDCIAINGFENVLLIGHIGKLVKVAGSIMDTHSRMADCRREIFAAHAAWCGASTETIHELFDSMTTDACIKILDDVNLRDQVIERIAQAVQGAADRRIGEFVRIGVIIFSNVYGLLAVTPEAQAIIDDWNANGIEDADDGKANQ